MAITQTWSPRPWRTVLLINILSTEIWKCSRKHLTHSGWTGLQITWTSCALWTMNTRPNKEFEVCQSLQKYVNASSNQNPRWIHQGEDRWALRLQGDWSPHFQVIPNGIEFEKSHAPESSGFSIWRQRMIQKRYGHLWRVKHYHLPFIEPALSTQRCQEFFNDITSARSTRSPKNRSH